MFRLMSLNENLKTKLDELEAARDALDKTDIEAKLDELRREKDGLGMHHTHSWQIFTLIVHF